MIPFLERKAKVQSGFEHRLEIRNGFKVIVVIDQSYEDKTLTTVTNDWPNVLKRLEDHYASLNPINSFAIMLRSSEGFWEAYRHCEKRFYPLTLMKDRTLHNTGDFIEAINRLCAEYLPVWFSLDLSPIFKLWSDAVVLGVHDAIFSSGTSIKASGLKEKLEFNADGLLFNEESAKEEYLTFAPEKGGFYATVYRLVQMKANTISVALLGRSISSGKKELIISDFRTEELIRF